MADAGGSGAQAGAGAQPGGAGAQPGGAQNAPVEDVQITRILNFYKKRLQEKANERTRIPQEDQPEAYNVAQNDFNRYFNAGRFLRAENYVTIGEMVKQVLEVIKYNQRYLGLIGMRQYIRAQIQRERLASSDPEAFYKVTQKAKTYIKKLDRLSEELQLFIDKLDIEIEKFTKIIDEIYNASKSEVFNQIGDITSTRDNPTSEAMILRIKIAGAIRRFNFKLRFFIKQLKDYITFISVLNSSGYRTFKFRKHNIHIRFSNEQIDLGIDAELKEFNDSNQEAILDAATGENSGMVSLINELYSQVKAVLPFQE